VKNEDRLSRAERPLLRLWDRPAAVYFKLFATARVRAIMMNSKVETS
jgi:hypothetical protein